MARTSIRSSIQTKQPEQTFVRPKRPPKTPSGPHGGWMKNPPEHCKHRKVDKEGVWAETTICASCKDPECDAYKLLKEGEKIRLKLMNTNKLAKECPYCKASLSHISENDVNYTYVCTTTGDRIEQTYKRNCGKQKSNVRRRR